MKKYLPWIAVLVLLVYAYVDLALVNQVAAPFLAPILIYFIYLFHAAQKEQKACYEEQMKKLQELQEQIEKLQTIQNAQQASLNKAIEETDDNH